MLELILGFLHGTGRQAPSYPDITTEWNEGWHLYRQMDMLDLSHLDAKIAAAPVGHSNVLLACCFLSCLVILMLSFLFCLLNLHHVTAALGLPCCLHPCC